MYLQLGKSIIKELEKSCNPCHQAKKTRNSFPLSVTKTQHPFNLIHIEIWGLYGTLSLVGANYFLTITDDYSRCTWNSC